MSAKDIRNIPASVLARLLNLSQKTGDDYQALLAKFASERFLYRLGSSALRDRFVLKGAMLLRVWSANPYRATRDLDLLRRGKGGVEAIRKDMEAICAVKVKVLRKVRASDRLWLQAMHRRARMTWSRLAGRE